MSSAKSLGWRVMGIIWGLDFLIWVSAFSVGVLLPKIREDMSIAPWQAGLLGSSFFLGFALLSIPTSVWLSRHGPKMVIVYSALLAGLFITLQAFSQNYTMLLLSRFGFVIAATARNAMVPLLMQQWFEARQAPLLNSIFSGVTALGQVMMFGAAPYLLLVTDWRSLYFINGAALMLMCLVWWRYGQERESQEYRARMQGQVGSPVRVIFREKALWFAAVGQMGVAFAGSSTMTFWPTYAVDEAGLPLTKVGLVMLFNPVAMVLGSALSGTITNALPRPRVLVMLPGVALPVIFIALLHVQSLPLLGLLFFGNGFVQALSIPLLMSVPFQLGLTPREVSVATAHMRTVVPTGGALGPIVVGLISGATGSLELAMTVTAPFAVTLLFGSQLLPGFQSRKQRLALRERERPAAGTSE